MPSKTGYLLEKVVPQNIDSEFIESENIDDDFIESPIISNAKKIENP
jgi:hypothetical protein